MAFDNDYSSEEPRTSITGGLLSLLTGAPAEHEQPIWYGLDSQALYGRSPDYPMYRDWEDYANFQAPFPQERDFQNVDAQGNIVSFDQQGYDEALRRYYDMRSMHPRDGNY